MEQVKSVLVTKFGGYDAIKVANYPLPKPKGDEVEVKVMYCGLNFSDLYTRQGFVADRPLPFVLGMECSGIITALGNPKNSIFKVGQKVVCYDYTGGMYRHKVVVPTNKCYSVPDNIDLKDAAAMFVSYLTAYFCVMELGHFRPNQHILISTCAGGVGWAATQLASLVDGAVLYGTTSPAKAKDVQANGIHHVLTYNNLCQQVKKLCPNGLDLIIDNSAGDDFHEKKDLMRSFGKIVLIGSNNIIQDEKQLSKESLENKTTNVALSTMIMSNALVGGMHLGVIAEKEPDQIREVLNKLFVLVAQHKIKPKIDSVWPMDDITEATKVLQERKNVGKVLLSTGLE